MLKKIYQESLDLIFPNRIYRRWTSSLDFKIAIAKNDIEAVRKMLSKGVDVNQVFENTGARPIHIAAALAGPAMIDCLLAAGANPLVGLDWATLHTLSPAGYARFMKREDNAEYLRPIEDAQRQKLIAAGHVPPVLFQEAVPLKLWRSCRSRRFPSLRSDMG